MSRRKSPRRPFTFVVDTKPTVKGRPRLGRRGRVFTPAKTLEAEAIIADHYKRMNGPYYEVPVQLDAVFRPDRIEATITPMPEHTSKLRGDTDNYLKLLCDALNGVAFPDDRQVMVIRGEKQ